MEMQREKIALNDRGNRIGESHHRAKLSDHDVDLVLELLDDAEEAKEQGLPYLTIQEIADKFEIHESTVRSYKEARRRAQIPERYKTMKVIKSGGGKQKAKVCKRRKRVRKF